MPEEAHEADIIVVPFRGRSRVAPEIYHILSKLQVELPVLGLESDAPENRDWPVIPMEIQLASDTPLSIIVHTIVKAADRNQKQKEFLKLQDNYRHRMTEIDFLVEMGLNFTGTLSRRELYTQILDKTQKLVPAELHLLFTFSRSTSIASLVGQRGIIPGKKPILPARRLSEEVISQFETLLAPIYAISPFEMNPLLTSEAAHLNMILSSLMIAPVISKERLIAYLVIGNRSGNPGFTSEDADHMEVLIHFAALALENAYLYEKTEHLAQIDDLTGVHNFKYGQIFVEKLIREKDRFGMLFLDLDGFKLINQTYGHIKGNEALRLVSSIIKNHIRSSDLISRFGGDEFMIVMPGVDIPTAHRVGETLIHKIEAQTSIPNVKLSGSIGVALFPDDGETLQSMIHLADSAMYYAKSIGTGKVVHTKSIKKLHGDIK